jgi:hypothetical protein
VSQISGNNERQHSGMIERLDVPARMKQNIATKTSTLARRSEGLFDFRSPWPPSARKNNRLSHYGRH